MQLRHMGLTAAGGVIVIWCSAYDSTLTSGSMELLHSIGLITLNDSIGHG